MKIALRNSVLLFSGLLGGIALAGVTCGCQGEGGTPTNLGLVASSIALTPSSLQLFLTLPSTPPICSLVGTITFVNPGTGASGSANPNNIGFRSRQATPNLPLTFTSSNPAVVTVQPSPTNPDAAVVQGVGPGTAIITATEPNSGVSAQASVTVLANGITDVVTGASTTDGFVGTLVNAVLPTGTGVPPMVNNSTISGVSGGTGSFTVNSAIPITDVLIGIQGQTGYLDINVNGPASQQASIPPILFGYQVTMNIVPNLCQQQFGLSIVLKDAAGNFTQPTSATVNLTSSTSRMRGGPLVN